MSNDPFLDFQPDNFEVKVDGNVVSTFNVSSVVWTTLTTASFPVSAGHHTITFQGLDSVSDHAVFLDSVSITNTGGGAAPTVQDAGFESPNVGTGSYYDFWYNPPSSAANEYYTYDNTGEPITYTDRNGSTHSYLYDLLGRNTQDSISSFGIGVDQSVAKLGYTYDINGELSTATSYNTSGGVLNQVEDTYDGFGQLAGDAQAHTGNVSGGTPTVSYGYDASNGDRPTSVEYPNGRTINYNYSSGLDSTLSRLSSISDSSGLIQSYTYLGAGTPVTLTDGNGVELNYGATGSGFDQFGRIIDQNWQNSSGTSIDDFQYGYDADSNVLYKNNTVLTSHSEVYIYDSLDRLTNYSTGTISFNGSTASISSPTTTEGWNLNAVGDWNSNTLNGTTTSRTYSAQNQVTTVGSSKISYDANGNTLWDQNGQIYIYNAWNQLIRVQNSLGAVIASYTYDALGRRITTTESGTTTNNYFDGQNLVMQQTSGGTVTNQFVWGSFYVNQLVQETNPSGTFYVQQDANWNVTSISNSSGSIVERDQYDPYGGIIVRSSGGTTIGAGISSSTVGQIFGFQGGWTDPITGLVHFQMRDLNTGLGVWIEQDPKEYVNGPDRYQLESSNSVASLDPSGMALILPGVGEYAAYPGIAGGVAVTGDQAICIGIDSKGLNVATVESFGVGPAFGTGWAAGTGPEAGFYPNTSDPNDLSGPGYTFFGAALNQDLWIDPPYGQPGGAFYGIPVSGPPLGFGDQVGAQFGAQFTMTCVQDIWSTSWNDYCLLDLLSNGPPIQDSPWTLFGSDIFEPDELSIPDTSELNIDLPSKADIKVPSTSELSWPNFSEFTLPSISDIHLPSIPLINQLSNLGDRIRGVEHLY